MTNRRRRGRVRRLLGGEPLEPISLHEARHTFASLMIAAGVNAKALSSYLGHSSISITFDRYGHLMPGNEEEAAGLLRRLPRAGAGSEVSDKEGGAPVSLTSLLFKAARLLGDRPRDPPRPEGHGEAARPDRHRPRVGPIPDPALAAVTSPPQRVEVECPRCQTVYATFWRPSVNLTLDEEWTVGSKLGTLVVEADGVWR